MDKFSQSDASPQRERELTSLLSPKRPRTECAVTEDLTGDNRDASPEPSKTVNCLSSNNLQNTDGLACTEESEGSVEKNPHDKPQGTESNAISYTYITTPQMNDAHTGSPEVCFISSGRHPVLVRRNEQSLVPEVGKPELCLRDDTGGSPTSVGTHTPRFSDCRQLGKSLEHETPGSCSLSTGNNEDGTQVQSHVSQIQAVTFSTSQLDSIHDDAVHETSLCNTSSQFAGVVDTNQKREELDFSENILFNKAGFKSPIFSGDFGNSKPLYVNHEEDPPRIFGKGGKNEKKKLEVQIFENEDVAFCDAETKGQINESSMSKTFTPSVAECTKGSILPYDAVLDRKPAAENVNLLVNNFNEADCTEKSPIAARISQEPAEGAHNAKPFSVIDPAIRMEADKEIEEMLCDSDSRTGIKLSPPVKVCKVETPLSHCSIAGISERVSCLDKTEQFHPQSRTQQSKDENEIFCQSRINSQACSILRNETHQKNENEGNCQWRSSPSSRPFDGDGVTQENHDAEGHRLKEQSQASCFPASFDHIKTQAVEYSQIETDRMEETVEMNEIEEVVYFLKETESDEQENLKQATKSEDELQLHNEQDKGDASAETQDCDSKLKYIDGELEIKVECLCDQPSSAEADMMDVAADEREGKEAIYFGEEMKTDGCENLEVQTKSRDNMQKQNEHKEDVSEESHGENISEWTKASRMTFCNVYDQKQRLGCVSDSQRRVDTSMSENRDEFLAFAFPSTSDAVVPCQLDLIPSQNTHYDSTALKCHDRFTPSAFTFSSRVLEGFDTFENIHLSPDDDDDDDASGLGTMPVLTSSPRLPLKTPQRQLQRGIPLAESDSHKEIPTKKAEEKFESHIENVGKGFVSSDFAGDEGPNLNPAADVTALRQPEQQPNCGSSACVFSEHTHTESSPLPPSSSDPTESDSPSSGLDGCCEFEMREQFDRVLKELKIFFDISRSDFASNCKPTSPEQCGDAPEPVEGDASKCTEHLSSPVLGNHRSTSTDEGDEDSSVEICGGDPKLSLAAVSSDGEQEVPVNKHQWQEVDAAETHREPQEMVQDEKMWSQPSMYVPLLEQLSYRLPELPRRLEPLKTCTRPIRVGLSKRARTKHLHRSHPYK